MASSTFPIPENISRIKASPKQTQVWDEIRSQPQIDFGWQQSKHTSLCLGSTWVCVPTHTMIYFVLIIRSESTSGQYHKNHFMETSKILEFFFIKVSWFTKLRSKCNVVWCESKCRIVSMPNLFGLLWKRGRVGQPCASCCENSRGGSRRDVLFKKLTTVKLSTFQFTRCQNFKAFANITFLFFFKSE